MKVESVMKSTWEIYNKHNSKNIEARGYVDSEAIVRFSASGILKIGEMQRIARVEKNVTIHQIFN